MTTRPYRPSNGAEGSAFEESFCAGCVHGAQVRTNDPDIEPCELLLSALLGDWPHQWVTCKEHGPRCTAFELHEDENEGAMPWSEHGHRIVQGRRCRYTLELDFDSDS